MPTNFFEKTFNSRITICIHEIHKRVKNQENIKEDLVKLWIELNFYYLYERAADYDFNLGLIRAKEVYSEFLQQLVYHSYLSNEGSQHLSCAHDLVEYLLNLSLFHYCSPYVPTKPAVIIWTDPLYGSTVLMDLCRYDTLCNIELHLIKMADSYGGVNTQGFQNYISMSNTVKYSALHFLVQRGNTELVLFLMQTAANAYGGRDTYSFRKFLEQENDLKRTPLNAAAVHSSFALAELLLGFGANPDAPDYQGLTARDNAPKVWEIFLPKREEVTHPGAMFLKGLFGVVKQQTELKGRSRDDKSESGVSGDMPPLKRAKTETGSSAAVQNGGARASL